MTNMNETELLGLMQRRIRKSGSQAAWARENGLSVPYVNDVLNCRRGPGASILRALGVEKVVIYRKSEGGSVNA